MTAELLLMADFASADKKINLLGVFSRIGVRRFPHARDQMMVAIQLRVNKSEVGKNTKLSLALIDPDGAPVVRIDNPDFTVEKDRFIGTSVEVPLVFSFENLTFRQPGTYRWTLEANAKKLGEAELLVEKDVQHG